MPNLDPTSSQIILTAVVIGIVIGMYLISRGK